MRREPDTAYGPVFDAETDPLSVDNGFFWEEIADKGVG
jgi:hypothetical protein